MGFLACEEQDGPWQQEGCAFLGVTLGLGVNPGGSPRSPAPHGRCGQLASPPRPSLGLTQLPFPQESVPT